MGSDFFLYSLAFSFAVLVGVLVGMALMGLLMRKACESAVERAREDERSKALAWGRGMIDQGDMMIGQMERASVPQL